MEFEFCIGAHARAAPNALHYGAEVFYRGEIRAKHRDKFNLLVRLFCENLLHVHAYFAHVRN